MGGSSNQSRQTIPRSSQGKLASVIWFLKRPKLYPISFICSNLSFLGDEADTREESERWCSSLAISVPEAILQVTGVPFGQPLADKFKAEFDEASRRAAACPVVMGGPGALDLLYYAAKHFRAEKVIETGVAYGWSSLALLLALRDRAGARLISTDMPYVQGDNDAYVGCVVPEELKLKWEIIKSADRQALPRALAKLGVIDLCHYDSARLIYECGLLQLWSALRPEMLYFR